MINVVATAARTALLGTALLSAGCTGLLGIGGGNTVDRADTVEDGGGQTGDLGVYLEAMRTVIDGDPLLRAETVRSAEEAADFAPTTTNRLLYALVLAVPGHPGSDAGEAQRRLTGLLASGDALLPAERLLATVQLRDVEQRLILEAAADQLREELAAAADASDAEAERRIRVLVEENRRLQSELDDATAKLDAITSIEQSIRELENGAD